MKHRSPSRRSSLALAGLLASAALAMPASPARAATPAWAGAAVIYCVNPEIFSSHGLPGVTAQIPRLKALGVNTIWLMPIYPRGHAVTVGGVARPSVNSPYCISDMKAVDPALGGGAALTRLVAAAHARGMRVILDMVLGQTSWDNPLVKARPGYYVHTDGDIQNLASIAIGYGHDSDIAEFNYKDPGNGVQEYSIGVCRYWLDTYHVDGFRFDSADSPSGKERVITHDFWLKLAAALRPDHPDILLLGEDESREEALSPFGMDYGWSMYGYGIVAAFTQIDNAGTLQYQWQYPYTIASPPPAGMLHMNIADDWDEPNRDVNVLGGYKQAMAAAVWDCTITGAPLIYNGMEVGNSGGGNNPHVPIHWSNPHAAAFTRFYTQLLALRDRSRGALQQGTTTFLTNSSKAVIAYDRRGAGDEYLVEINTNGVTAAGSLQAPGGAAWTEVTPATGAGVPPSHLSPGKKAFLLPPYGFAVFRRPAGAAKLQGPGVAGSLSVISGPTSIDLTGTGATDWAAYGHGPGGYEHDAGGGGKISPVTAFGGGALSSFTSNFLSLAWSNGAPDASTGAESDGYYNAGGVGDGFQLTAPASPTPQTLTVYVGGYTTGGTLTATLSDGSGSYTDSSLSGPSISYYGAYTLTYRSATPGATLTVVWKQASGSGNVTIYGAALH